MINAPNITKVAMAALPLCFVSAGFGQVSEESSPDFRTAEIRLIQPAREDWHQYVRGFRREHHFSTSLGYGAGTWRFSQLGDVERDDVEVESYLSRFIYSFHIPISSSVGYFLGTSVGVSSEQFLTRRVKVDSVYSVPGILLGLAWDYNPGLRFAVGVDHYLERYEGFSHREAVDGDQLMSFAVNVTDLFIWTDIFFRLNLALRVELHNRQTTFIRPPRAQEYLVGGRMAKKDQWLGLGLVYHLM